MITVLVGNDADGGFDFLFAGDAVFLHSAQDILHVGVVQRLAGAGPAHGLYNVDALAQKVQPDSIENIYCAYIRSIQQMNIWSVKFTQKMSKTFN